MLRDYALKKAARAKAQGLSDAAIRYNPYLRRRVTKLIAEFEHAVAAGDPDPGAHLTQRALAAAQRTTYGAGRPSQLAAWPVLEKTAIREYPEQFLTPNIRLRIPAGTGGTTGIPLKLWRSLESIVAEQLFIDRLLAPHGLSMRAKMAVLRADTVKAPDDTAPPYGRISHGGNRLTLSSPHLTPDTLPWFHDALARFSPAILWVYPSSAVNLLTLLRHANLRLNIPVILASSEMLSAGAHTALEEYFSAQVINYYGQAERVCFAWSTKPGIFYFEPAYGRVELLPAPIDDITDAELPHAVIASNYWNLAMPLPRYNTGDLIYLPRHYGVKERAEIALGQRPFSGIAGRDGEYLLTKDGMRIIGLNQIPREIRNVFQMQLVQRDAETLHIHVIAMPGFSEQDAGDIMAQARAKIPPSIAVTVHRVERLQQTTRGKTPLVIRTFS